MATKFMNFVNMSLIHEQHSNDGRTFYNISVPCEKSKNGYGSIAVNPGQLLDAKKFDGTVVEGYKSILLGAEDKERNVSIATNKNGTSFKTIKLTNAAIAAGFEAARAAYKATLAVTEA